MCIRQNCDCVTLSKLHSLGERCDASIPYVTCSIPYVTLFEQISLIVKILNYRSKSMTMLFFDSCMMIASLILNFEVVCHFFISINHFVFDSVFTESSPVITLYIGYMSITPLS